MQTTTLGELVESIKERMRSPYFAICHALSPVYYYIPTTVGVFKILSTIYDIPGDAEGDSYLVKTSADKNNRFILSTDMLSKDTVLVQLSHLPRKLLMHLEDGNWCKTQTVNGLMQKPNSGSKYRFHGEYEPLPLLCARLEVKYFNTLTQRPLILAAYIECRDIPHAEDVISRWVKSGAETVLTYGHLSAPSLDTIYIDRKVSAYVQTMTSTKVYSSD